jgi:sulfur-oxidizing protein SoxB
MEDVMNHTAITYPYTTVNELTGEQIKELMEDACDNVFNPDPFYQQGGDMVRVGGLQYTVNPAGTMGNRISNLTVRGKPLDPGRKYKVASWAPLAEGATGEPVWDVVAKHLRARKVIQPVKANLPTVIGVAGNPGFAPEEGVTKPAGAAAPVKPEPTPAPKKAAPKKS